MDDAEILNRIHTIVEAQRELRQQQQEPGDHPDVPGQLRGLEESLDQCWDLLRQRDALKDAGADPNAAKPRPVSEVEGYLQ